jgi:60 kDa SS-A/Ro ribonucleoprotein
MANQNLFASAVARLLPGANALNREAAPAYAYEPRALLAQLAATGTLSDTFYGTAADQLQRALDAAVAVDPLFVAKAALYARQCGAMKDMPALLTVR